MIAVDTSAFMAIALAEAEAEACIAVLEAESVVLVSAATLAEALIVADRRNVGREVESLVDGLGFDIVAFTAASARRVAAAYSRWGKGGHPAGLNLGDCFACEVAKEHACKLLYVGMDFGRTDCSRRPLTAAWQERTWSGARFVILRMSVLPGALNPALSRITSAQA